MKTNLSTLCIVSLLFCACGEKAGNSAASPGSEGSPRGTRGGVLLTTDLPPELLEGTPRPIILPMSTPMSKARPQDILARPNPAPPPLLPPPGLPPPTPEARHEQNPGGFLTPGPQPAPVDRERYGELIDNPWQTPVDAPLSTFSIDVDTASYANVRSMILEGRSIPMDAVRLEEMVNYFDYSYPQPTDNHPFAIHVDNATSPWNKEHQLVRVALKGLEIERTERPPANLVFLLDVSGSMKDPRKLPLVTAALELLLEELNASDTLSIIVYAGAEGMALPPTTCDSQSRERITAALRSFRAGGTTNGGAGIKLAYQIAREQFKPGGINRVILATDGDFNVGVTGDGALVRMVAENAKSNVYLTVIGVGTGNLNDGMLEAITNKGNGVYYYIDSLEEARRVFLQKLMGTLVTIAKDVKIQVEFNPGQVRGYRLLGYANRMLRKEDFSNDRIDAGDIGSGHTVTAYYEIETGDARNMPPAESLRYDNPQQQTPSAESAALAPPANREWLTIKLRYKQPDGERSTLIERSFTGVARAFGEADADFRFGTSVAMAAMILRKDEGLDATRFGDAGMLAAAALGSDPHGCRTEFVSLLKRLATRPH
jgi:Ca-activated chloride channel family protein